MSWSPTEPNLALLKGDVKKQPNKVVFLQIPGYVELMHKDILSVSDCKMYWQSNGKYLAVQVEGITTEALEVDEKILAFAWEPIGHRFAVIHGDQSNPDVSFYSMETLKNPGKVSKLATFDDKEADALFWSPRGKHIVLAGLKGCFNALWPSRVFRRG
ncbi:unnamed protein product [Arabidopsis thaliana]|uniref:Translation initiation factor beta propellor-like domain-containing protein n=1 Tax=Arabidopsis thaliana TaxID=3702 RepID=A0A654ESL1_ARATH|nr:unnamed protein product [Arabidopsis thaliana]